MSKAEPTSATPAKVEGFSATEMLLEWNNGESFAVPYRDIRYFCPCAFCVDENTGKRKIKREDVAPTVKPMQAHQVGQYALKFWWTDRHNSGIYSFDSLLEICHAAGRLLKAGEQATASGKEQGV